MDIYCRNCGEPWDNDSIHEEAQIYGLSYAEVAKDFRRNGCSALGSRCSTNDADPTVALAYELMGDDMDGAASILEDYL